MTNDALIVSVLVAIVTLSLVYGRGLQTQRDLPEVALLDQTHSSTTRKPHETVVLRNKLVPHGFPLLKGLQIKDAYRLRDGNVRDIWSLVLESPSSTIQFFELSGKPVFSKSYSELNYTMKKIIQKIGGESICLVLPFYDWRSIVLCLASLVSSTSFHLLHAHLVRPALANHSVVVVSWKHLRAAVQYAKEAKYIIVTDPEGKDAQKDPHSFEEYAKVCLPRELVTWDLLFGLETGSDQSFDHTQNKQYDEESLLSETINFSTTVYTTQNLVASVANELKLVAQGHEWSSQDELLVLAGESSLALLPKLLAAFVNGMSVKIIEPLISNAIYLVDFETVERIKAREEELIHNRFVKILSKLTFDKNVICLAPQRYLKAFVAKEKEEFDSNPLLRRMFIGRSQMLFQQGVFSKLGQDPLFSKFRLIFSYTYKALKQEEISSFDLSLLRTLTGCRIVCERYVAGNVGPLLSTHMYDYRIIEADEDDPRELKVLRGVPVQGVEAKLIDYKVLNDEFLAENDEGELCVRGFIIGKCTDKQTIEEKTKEGIKAGGEGWMPTGLIGKIGEDGCFYERVYDL